MNCVLTCEDWPQLLPIEEMRAKDLQHLCNRWTKTEEAAGSDRFRLSFPYTEDLCACNLPERYKNGRQLAGIHRCEACHKYFSPIFPEGTLCYLQNSGTEDQVWADPHPALHCLLQQVPGHPDVYQWVNDNDREKKRWLFVLNIHEGYLSDKNLYKYGTGEINERVLPFCRLLFPEDL